MDGNPSARDNGGRMATSLVLPLLLILGFSDPLPATAEIDSTLDPTLESALASAGERRAELERALAETPAAQRPAMEWLIVHMPEEDRATLDAAFLREHCDEAFVAWKSAPWRESVPWEVFLDAILPYACLAERRDAWREPLRALCVPLVAGATSPGEAATRINRGLFAATGVHYSTARARADQSPLETLEWKTASCTGLSILLVDACRSVGVPARLVGVPLWLDRSGNHAWVEVWDGSRWRYTGAAEPTDDRLDEAWFTGRATTAIPGDPRHGIHAVTWTDSPRRYPVSFNGRPSPSRSIDVTERYLAAAAPLPASMGLLRVEVRRDGRRVPAAVVVEDRDGAILAAGVSRDDRFDRNDLLEFRIPKGATVRVRAAGTSVEHTIERDEDRLRLAVEPGAGTPSSEAVDALAAHLLDRGFEDLATAEFASVPLSRADAARAAAILRTAFAERRRAIRRATHEARRIERDGLVMPYWFIVLGEKPDAGRSLYISMHGGGQAPKELHDKQWENQQRLYRPAEGVYLAPRAPTDTWNLWHQGHVDGMFDDLIADLVVFEGVDPDRVYLMGYSAGGDGVYQLAPRMADRFAAAAMMAGHPNEASPEGLRNLPIILQCGAEDHLFDRANVARRFGEALAAMQAQDPGGYEHLVKLHEGKQHWMEKQDALALPWMAAHRRDLRPDRVVWRQDDVTGRRFYWLAVSEPAPGARVIARRDGQVIRLEEWTPQGELRIRLDDSMLDLDEVVVVLQGEEERFRGRVPRTIATLARTLEERGDPTGLFSGEVVLTPAPP